jgi:hypothetical protein
MDDLAPDPDVVAGFEALRRDVDDLALVCNARGWHDPIVALKAAGHALQVGGAFAKGDAETRPALPRTAGFRRGKCISTYTGRKFWPLDPRPQEVSATDIAVSVSREPRWGGHSRRVVTVGEHCFRVAALVHYLVTQRSDIHPLPAHLHAWAVKYALLHDSAEAYLRDLLRPVKEYVKGWELIEEAVLRVIYEYLGLGVEPDDVHHIIKFADQALLVMEAAALFDHDPLGDNINSVRASIVVTPEMYEAAGFAAGRDGAIPVAPLFRAGGLPAHLGEHSVAGAYEVAIRLMAPADFNIDDPARWVLQEPAVPEPVKPVHKGRSSWAAVANDQARMIDGDDLDLDGRLAQAEEKNRRAGGSSRARAKPTEQAAWADIANVLAGKPAPQEGAAAKQLGAGPKFRPKGEGVSWDNLQEALDNDVVPITLKGLSVEAIKPIVQSPCAEDEAGNPPPDVPTGVIGMVDRVEDDDEDDITVWVDFGPPYGPVLCYPENLREAL